MLAKLDANNEVYETSKSDNLSGPLSGTFQGDDGTVYVLDDPGITGSDAIDVSQDAATGDNTVAVSGDWPRTFQEVLADLRSDLQRR